MLDHCLEVLNKHIRKIVTGFEKLDLLYFLTVDSFIYEENNEELLTNHAEICI